MNRRAWLSRSLSWMALVGLLLLIACGGPASPQPGQAKSAPDASPAIAGKITILLSEDAEGLQAVKSIVTTFNVAQPGVDVTLNNIPDANEFLKRLAADIAAQTAPDLFVINYRRFGQFAIKGAVDPIDDYIAKSKTLKLADYYPAALDAFKLKGKQYCLPQNLSSLQVYYNKKLFSAAGVAFPKTGWTWGDFLNAGRALTKDTNGDGKVDQYGVGVATQTLRLAPFIWAHGGELVDDPNRPTRLMVDSGAALEAFKWFVDLQVKEKVTPDKTEEATENSQSRFQRGTVAMYLNSRAVTPEFRATIKDFEWDVAPLPGDKHTVSVLHSDGYCMTSASKNKDAAWAFLEFTVGLEGQKLLVSTGRTVPSIKSVAETPAFLSPAAPPANNRVYLDMASNIRRLPIITTWPEIEEIFNREIRRAFYGDVSVEEAAQTAVKATNDLFQQGLKDLEGR